jgi:Prolipoprotein diacylglyceryl transferase
MIHREMQIAQQENGRRWPRSALVFDALARTRLAIAGRSLPSFQVCGYTGVLAAFALTMTLVVKTGLSPLVMGLIILSAMATFLALVMATKIITGEEQIIYYHHEIAVMLVTALVVKALHKPVFPYLDLTILGIGAFLACGRVGCLMVGCCHGRPFRWGIRYRQEHAQEGFAPYLVGITLFPVQALEALWVLFIVVGGAVMIWRGQAPGSALALYTVGYGAARFSFEFIRGDTDRPYTWRFSQGQWLSLWLMSTLLWAEWTGRMPLHSWHAATLVGLVAMMVAATVHRKLDSSQRFRILHPHHVREVAVAISHEPETLSNSLRLDGKRLPMRVEFTSLGFQISQGKAQDAAGVLDHYTLSHRTRSMSRPAARLLADLILGLRGESVPARLVSGNYGVFHLMLPRDRRTGVAI